MPMGPGCCHCAPATCPLCIDVLGCGEPLVGASVTIKQSGATVASGTTVGVITGLTLTAGGTGYTSPPTVTISGGGGSGSTATAAIGGGAVTGLTLTSAGSGYTSTPTVTITGGFGSGATATANFVARFCASLDAGNYTYDVSSPGLRTATDQPVTLACPGGATVTASIGAPTGTHCFCGPCPIPTTVTLNDPTYGATSIFFNVGTGWTNTTTATVSFAGCDGCPASDVKVIYILQCLGGDQWELQVARECNPLGDFSTSEPSIRCPGIASCSGGLGADFQVAITVPMVLVGCSPLLLEVDPAFLAGSTDILYCWVPQDFSVTP